MDAGNQHIGNHQRRNRALGLPWPNTVPRHPSGFGYLFVLLGSRKLFRLRDDRGTAVPRFRVGDQQFQNFGGVILALLREKKVYADLDEDGKRHGNRRPLGWHI